MTGIAERDQRAARCSQLAHLTEPLAHNRPERRANGAFFDRPQRGVELGAGLFTLEAKHLDFGFPRGKPLSGEETTHAELACARELLLGQNEARARSAKARMRALSRELVVAALDAGQQRAARYALADPYRNCLDPAGDLGGDARLVERHRLRRGVTLGIDGDFRQRLDYDCRRGGRRLDLGISRQYQCGGEGHEKAAHRGCLRGMREPGCCCDDSRHRRGIPPAAMRRD